jgi:dTDP-4-dehydrorhamnose reductase
VSTNTRKLLIIGSGGRLGAALVRIFSGEWEVAGFNHAQLDISRADELREKIASLTFDMVINCAAQTNVDRCESERDEAFAINAEAPGVLAEICTAKNARLVHISTDYVFDGNTSQPYTELDEPRPISVYGESKRAGEERVLAVSGDHVIARVSWVFGPDRPSFVDAIIKRAMNEERVDAIADKLATPTYTLDIAEMLRPLLDRATEGGIYHLTNRGVCSWRDYGEYALQCCTREGIPLRTEQVLPLSLGDMKAFIARRPIYTALSTEKLQRVTGIEPRPWQEAVAAYVRDHVAPRSGGTGAQQDVA